MRRLGVSALVIVVAGLLGIAVAQSFSGTFVATESQMTVTIQQNQDGTLSGSITGQTGQYPLQGQASGLAAYGAAASQQGMLGFQAELSGDGQTMQMMFYQSDANNQPTPVSPVIVLQRQGGGVGAMPPQVPGGQAPGGVPGQMPGGMPGQAPGGMPGQAPGGIPGQVPGQVPGGMPGQVPGGVPGQFPGGMPGGVPGQVPGQMPGQMPGTIPGQAPGGLPPMVPPTGPQGSYPPMADWNGTFVGNAGTTALVVQGGQGAYSGYIEDQGQRYPFQAHLDDATLHGTSMANGNQFEFWADREGTTVYLYVGDTTYYLEFAGVPGVR